jgi:hypothetical protein
MADRERETTDGLGGLVGLQYDTGGSDRLVVPCDPSAGTHCYPAYTYDAQRDRLATPPTPPQEPEADAPVVRPVRTN